GDRWEVFVYCGDFLGIGSNELAKPFRLEGFGKRTEGENPAGQPFQRVIEQGDVDAFWSGLFLDQTPGAFAPDAVHGDSLEPDTSHFELSLVSSALEITLERKIIVARKEFVLQVKAHDAVRAEVPDIAAQPAIGDEMPVI